MIISYFLMMLLIISTLGKPYCDDIQCANVFDYVCGMAESEDGTQIIQKYRNICFMEKKACQMGEVVEINQVADELCNIKKDEMITEYFDDNQGESRRVNDFSIVGAHQACNHSCPTYCTDAYQPACAQIWKRNMVSYTYRPMINHCHIDLFSCASGLNVTIQPLGKCYKNPSGLLFMQHVAAMKSLKLLDEDHELLHHNHPERRTNVMSHQPVPAAVLGADVTLKEQLVEVVRRIFAKYHKGLN